MKKSYVALGVIALLVAGGTVFALTQLKQEQSIGVVPPPLRQAVSAPTPVETSNVIPKLIIGDSRADLTIIEYSDPQCPICKRFFEQTEPQLLREYIDTGKAQLELRPETHIGQGSQLAGEAWYCSAAQGKFKPFHDETFRQQNGGFTTPKLKLMAARAGLDQAEFNACLDSGKYTAAVEASDAEAKQRISGTPTFFVGSQKIAGAQPFSVFKTVIETELK